MDWGVVVGIVGIVIAVMFGFLVHFHSKLANPEGRAELIADMLSRDMAKGYADGLGRALQRLRLVAGGPGSWQTFGFCLIPAMIYALLAALAGWGGGQSTTLETLLLVKQPEKEPRLDALIVFLLAFASIATAVIAFKFVPWCQHPDTKLANDKKPRAGKLDGFVSTTFAITSAFCFAYVSADQFGIKFAIAFGFIVGFSTAVIAALAVASSGHKA